MENENYWENYDVLKLETWTNKFSPEELNLDKLREYLDFIVQAVKRYNSNRYSEWHHVMPKCIDKEKKYRDQGVQINGSDHFRAHLKLVECFKGNMRSLMAYSLVRMKGNMVSNGEVIAPEDWEKARTEYAKANSERGRKRVGPLNSMYGKHRKWLPSQYESARLRMKGNTLWKSENALKYHELLKEKFKGEGNPFYGKRHTEETKKMISEGRTGSLNPCYRKLWITNGVVCKRISFEELETYISQGFWQGRIVSKEARKAMSESQSKRARDSKGRWI